MAQITYHGHSCFTIETKDGVRIMIDPFFTDSPYADRPLSEVGHLDFILVTHGHADHFADVVPLAKTTGATVVASYEIFSFLATQGIDNAHPLHIGGGWDFPFGRVKMTPAIHGGAVHGDESGQFSTTPAGFLIHVDGCRLYHAGDTALTVDMSLLEGQVDVALLPIGDNFTMGPDDAVRAIDFIRPSVVVPIHYTAPGVDGWGWIAQDPEVFRTKVGDRATVEIMKSGDVLDLPS